MVILGYLAGSLGSLLDPAYLLGLLVLDKNDSWKKSLFKGILTFTTLKIVSIYGVSLFRFGYIASELDFFTILVWGLLNSFQLIVLYKFFHIIKARLVNNKIEV